MTPGRLMPDSAMRRRLQHRRIATVPAGNEDSEVVEADIVRSGQIDQSGIGAGLGTATAGLAERELEQCRGEVGHCDRPPNVVGEQDAGRTAVQEIEDEALADGEFTAVIWIVAVVRDRTVRVDQRDPAHGRRRIDRRDGQLRCRLGRSVRVGRARRFGIVDRFGTAGVHGVRGHVHKSRTGGLRRQGNVERADRIRRPVGPGAARHQGRGRERRGHDRRGLYLAEQCGHRDTVGDVELSPVDAVDRPGPGRVCANHRDAERHRSTSDVPPEETAGTDDQKCHGSAP